MIPRRLRLKRACGNDYAIRLAQLRYNTVAMRQGVGSAIVDAMLALGRSGR